MPNDTTITISKRVIPDNFVVDSLASLKPIIEQPKAIDVSLIPAPELPKFTFVYDSSEGIMPIDTIYTFAKSVNVVAYPMDCHVDSFSIMFVGFITLAYFFAYLGSWVKFVRELRGV